MMRDQPKLQQWHVRTSVAHSAVPVLAHSVEVTASGALLFRKQTPEGEVVILAVNASAWISFTLVPGA